jgi:hypothetical protein
MKTTTDGKKYISILDVHCNCGFTGGCDKCRKIVEEYNTKQNNKDLITKEIAEANIKGEETSRLTRIYNMKKIKTKFCTVIIDSEEELTEEECINIAEKEEQNFLAGYYGDISQFGIKKNSFI